MKNYLVCIIQKGEGCDYTIGCGRAVKKYEAKDPCDLYKKVYEDFEMYFDEDNIESAYFVEIENVNCFEEIDDDYKEYLRLKNKYENC